MEFLVKVLSGNSRGKDRYKDAEDFRQAFKDNLDTVKRILEEQGSEVRAVVYLIYDSSFPEEQIFMKAPSLAKLEFNKELVSKLLSALDSQGLPVMGMMLDMIWKHGMHSISDALMAVLELLAPLLESKEAPEFTTDDVLDAMGWHTSSNNASPLLTALASITSSTRVSVASAAKAAARLSHSVSDKYPAATHETVPGNFADRASYQLNLIPQEMADSISGRQHTPRHLELDDRPLGKDISKELDASTRDVVVEQRVKISEIENSNSEGDSTEIQDAFNVGPNKANRISALELQQYVLGSDAFGRKPTSRAESGTKVEEPEEEARMSESDNSNPIAEVKSAVQQQLCNDSAQGIQEVEHQGDEHLYAKPIPRAEFGNELQAAVDFEVQRSESTEAAGPARTGATASTGEEGAMIVAIGTTANGNDDRDLNGCISSDAAKSSKTLKTQQKSNSEAGERKRVLDGRWIPKTDNLVSKLRQRLCCGKPATKP